MTKPQPERIQKLLARAGVGSRRQIEVWIKEGRIRINGRPAALGDRIALTDKVRLDGREISLAKSLPAARRVLAYYKPAGEVCTRRDPEGRRTVFDRLPRIKRGRWINIGRLDINTQGLLLFTNDGELANRFMHPSHEIEREYAVRVLGKVGQEQIGNLTKGVKLEDGPARFSSVTDAGGEGSNHWYHVVIMEGRNREVRRLWEAVGVKVSRLIRIRYGPYSLPSKYKTGQFWDLDPVEVEALAAAVGMGPETINKVESESGGREANSAPKPRRRPARRR